MGSVYLSPAFTKRPEQDLRLLQSLDGRSGFCLFWLDIVYPLLCEIRAGHLLEIGADEGEHTRLLLEYCDIFDAKLVVVEPTVKPCLEEILRASSHVRLFAEKSHDALPKVDLPVNAVLLEGDLNYHTTYGDLSEIEKLARRQSIDFPTVFVRSASWPYAKRDMYYDPESLPRSARHDYARSGMTPWSCGLKERMINFPFANARHEGGPKNGVWLAVTDFLANCSLPLKQFLLPSNNGLGLIYRKDSKADQFINQHLLIPERIRLFLETCEIARINEINRRQQIKVDRSKTEVQKESGIRNLLARALRKLGRTVLKRIEK